MTAPLVSVIVATAGRPTLRRTLESLGGDRTEVIVVADEREKPLPDVFALTASMGPRFRAIAHKSPHCDWGNSGRNAALPLVRGHHIAFLDDDDVWAADAPERLYAALSVYPDAPLIWRMRYGDGRVLWASERLHVGNVGTPMFALPVDLAQRARWGDEYTSDYCYLRDALGAAPPVWLPDVLVDVRPA